MIHYKYANADGHQIFYREAGPANAPTVLLLHGFPTSSHMFRNLIPALAGEYHVVAPDLPGFGFTESPIRKGRATFEQIATTINSFVEAIGLKSYALYIFDYGAPTGLRLALAHPERVTAIITQNGNAYEEGLSEGWNPIQRYWKEPNDKNRAALREFLSPEAVKDGQYLYGVKDPSLVAPESYTLDSALMARPGNDQIQLDLFLDYASNVALYPKFQEYFRTKRPPLLAVWGKNDPFFIPPGAEAYKRDNPDAEVHFLDTGHFALETNHREIAAQILDFLGRKVKA